MLLLLTAACAHRAASPEPAAAASAEPPAWAGSTCGTSMPDIVATIDGVPVRREELTSFDPQALIEAETAASQARADALDGLIVRRLLDKKAAEESMEPEAWIDREIGAKMTPVTDAEVESFYKENYDQMQGAALSEISPRIREHLEGQRAEVAAAQVVDQLTQGVAIERFLEPFRVMVDDGGGPRLGPADAPIEIIEFSDFQCPYCARAAETVHELVERYEGKVTVVFRNYPLPFHDAAHRAAQAAVCAGEQDAFWGYHDALFADQKSWTDEDLKGYAKTLKLDGKAFEACLASERPAAVVDADLAAGTQVGMTGTPGFYVNGIVLSGALPLEVCADLVEAELARTDGSAAP